MGSGADQQVQYYEMFLKNYSGGVKFCFIS